MNTSVSLCLVGNIASQKSFARHRGFTLIELMATIAVLAVLITIAAPDLSQFIVRNRLTGQANQLLGDLSLTRSEAAARHTPVTICAAASATACAGAGTSNWESGWIVFVDSDGDGAMAATTDIIKYVAAPGGNSTIVSSGFTNTDRLTYRPFGGLLPAQQGTFTLCVSGYQSGNDIRISATGRPLASKITTC